MLAAMGTPADQPLDDDALRALAHAHLTFNAPLSEARAAELRSLLAVAHGEQVLDIGCGDAELLLRLCAGGASGVGVDLDAAALARARAKAQARGLAGRVRLVEADGRTWQDPADVVVSIGAAHVWGGAPAALEALHALTRPGGRLLYGDGIWGAAPTRDALDIFGELPTLADLADTAVAAGWRPLAIATSTLDEHDAWESAWRAGLERSGHPSAWALADERRREYLGGYRGVLGFAWLVLLRHPSPPR
jgi:SAM-dependent methyltransferase